MPSPVLAEIFAQVGWDSLTIDLQHGFHDYASLVTTLQAIHARPVAPMVRVPWNEPGILGKVLDAGAQGVICPMVNKATDAARFVDAYMYPPHGSRSSGSIRGAPYGAPLSPAEVNRDLVLLPQIETAEAVANVDDILGTPGIAGNYVGPSDLGLSLGLPARMDREEPQVLEICTELIEACASRGLIPGIHTATAAYAARMIGIGFRFVTVGSDSGFVMRGSQEAVTTVRAQVRGSG